jgi:hypothetical protein
MGEVGDVCAKGLRVSPGAIGYHPHHMNLPPRPQEFDDRPYDEGTSAPVRIDDSDERHAAASPVLDRGRTGQPC